MKIEKNPYVILILGSSKVIQKSAQFSFFIRKNQDARDHHPYSKTWTKIMHTSKEIFFQVIYLASFAIWPPGIL